MPLPWYKDGLRFRCTGCGKCCTGSPGYVWVSLEEMQEIAEFLKIPLNDFTSRYVRKVGGRYSLIESSNFDCVFLRGKECGIYSVRPKQCRTYPFWGSNLQSAAAWECAKKECEGISETAPLITLGEVEKLKDNDL